MTKLFNKMNDSIVEGIYDKESDELRITNIFESENEPFGGVGAALLSILICKTFKKYKVKYIKLNDMSDRKTHNEYLKMGFSYDSNKGREMTLLTSTFLRKKGFKL